MKCVQTPEQVVDELERLLVIATSYDEWVQEVLCTDNVEDAMNMAVECIKELSK